MSFQKQKNRERERFDFRLTYSAFDAGFYGKHLII